MNQRTTAEIRTDSGFIEVRAHLRAEDPLALSISTGGYATAIPREMCVLNFWAIAGKKAVQAGLSFVDWNRGKTKVKNSGASKTKTELH